MHSRSPRRSQAYTVHRGEGAELARLVVHEKLGRIAALRARVAFLEVALDAALAPAMTRPARADRALGSADWSWSDAAFESDNGEGGSSWIWPPPQPPSKPQPRPAPGWLRSGAGGSSVRLGHWGGVIKDESHVDPAGGPCPQTGYTIEARFALDVRTRDGRSSHEQRLTALREIQPTDRTTAWVGELAGVLVNELLHDVDLVERACSGEHCRCTSVSVVDCFMQFRESALPEGWNRFVVGAGRPGVPPDPIPADLAGPVIVCVLSTRLLLGCAPA